MRIAIIGAQLTGKSSYVEQFLQRWPMYSKPTESYRDIIKAKGLQINRDSCKLSQQEIMDALVVQAQQASDQKYVIHDRCILDNLAYTAYHALAGNTDIDPEFFQQSTMIANQVVKMYDIIFYFPTAGFDVDGNNEREQRDTDQEFRQSIDNIFQTFYTANLERKGVLFDREDSPPIIPLGGQVVEKLVLTSLYVDDNGDPYETGFNLTEELDKMPRIITP